MTDHQWLSPVGVLRASLHGDSIRSLGLSRWDEGIGDVPESIRSYLERFFSGVDPGRFPYRVDLDGFSPFQRDVLEALMGVGYGSVVTYSRLSEICGHPGASRAVGNAVGANPIILVIPCHRVVGRAGDRLHLGGFSSGLDVKRTLLRIEGHSSDIEGL